MGKGGERDGEGGEEDGRRKGKEREGKGDRGNGRDGTGHRMGGKGKGKEEGEEKGGEGVAALPNFNSLRRYRTAPMDGKQCYLVSYKVTGSPGNSLVVVKVIDVDDVIGTVVGAALANIDEQQTEISNILTVINQLVIAIIYCLPCIW